MKLALVCAVLVAMLVSSAVAADDRTIPPAPAVAAVLPADALPPAPSAMIKLKQKPAEHRFFDTKNSLPLAFAAATITGDAIFTQRALANPIFHEMNPLARPFVKTKGGAAAYSAGSVGLLTGLMYVAHKKGHHKIERFLPVVVGGWEGFLIYRNNRLIADHNR